MASLNGTYVFNRIDKTLSAQDNWAMRTIINSLSRKTTLQIDGDKLTIKQKTSLNTNSEVVLTLGGDFEEFQDDISGGGPAKLKAWLQGETLYQLIETKDGSTTVARASKYDGKVLEAQITHKSSKGEELTANLSFNRKQAKVISVFNHKGGVGKTTTTIGVGWKLAQSGKRVLLVDADPQCNLTGFLVDPGVEFITDNPPQDPLEQFYDKYPMCNIYTSLAPALADEATVRELKLVKEPNTNLNRNQVVTEVFKVADRNVFLNTEPTDHFRDPKCKPPPTLHLLAGHPDFQKYESNFQLAKSSPAAYPNAGNIPGIFRYLFQQLSEKHNLDYILVDMSPSASVTNQLIILSSDYIIMPCSPDFFSHMAIKSMTLLLLEWDQWKSTRTLESNVVWPLPKTKPILLGYTIQIFTVSRGKPAMAFQRWVEKIQETIQQHMIPRLSKRGMAKLENPHIELAQIRNFQSAGAASTRCHVPVFALTEKLVKLCDASNYSTEHIQFGNTAFDEIVNKVTQFQIPQADLEYQMHCSFLQQYQLLDNGESFENPQQDRQAISERARIFEDALSKAKTSNNSNQEHELKTNRKRLRDDLNGSQ